MGAGKTTLSKQISRERDAVLICEDEWLLKLYPNQIVSLDDYLRFSSLLKPLIRSHVINILNTGTNVVMDFPANTIKQRQWFKEIFTEINAPNELIFLNVSDEKCLKQIGKRRIEQPERAIYDTESMFLEVTQYFQAPDEKEGFNIKVLDGDN